MILGVHQKRQRHLKDLIDLSWIGSIPGLRTHHSNDRRYRKSRDGLVNRQTMKGLHLLGLQANLFLGLSDGGECGVGIAGLGRPTRKTDLPGVMQEAAEPLGENQLAALCGWAQSNENRCGSKRGNLSESLSAVGENLGGPDWKLPLLGRPAPMGQPRGAESLLRDGWTGLEGSVLGLLGIETGRGQKPCPRWI